MKSNPYTGAISGAGAQIVPGKPLPKSPSGKVVKTKPTSGR